MNSALHRKKQREEDNTRYTKESFLLVLKIKGVGGTYCFQSTMEDQDIFDEKQSCMSHHTV